MISILCYGDSNTYGHVPVTGTRYARNERYPGVLQNLLGKDYYVIEEGLNGRTTYFDDPREDRRNGLKELPLILKSHHPLDFIILALGINDCKMHLARNELSIAVGMEALCECVMNFGKLNGESAPRIIIVSPVPIAYTEEIIFGAFDKESIRESNALAPLYAKVARSGGYLFLDAGKYAETGADCLHLTREGHLGLANGLAEMILESCSR